MKKAGKGKKSFLTGAAILGAAGLVCKLIGAFYRIPLSNNILHKEGIAYYQMAYPIYTWLLVVSSAGLPTAISRMVAQRVQQGREHDAHGVFRVALLLLVAIGILTTGILLVFSKPIASALGNENAAPAIAAIAPALLLVSVMCAYRGYFQGLQNMVPTAVSQIIEQLGKLVFGFSLASYMMRYGAPYGAAGALLGVSISEALGMAYIMLRKALYGKTLARRLRFADKYTPEDGKESPKSALIQLVKIAVPITLGASIMPLVGITDTAIVINRLQSIGFAADTATNLYGLLTGNVNTVVNMPQVLTSALAMALVPAIASSLSARKYGDMRKTAQQGMKLAWLIGLPCFAGLLMLALPVMRLLYSSYSAEDLAIMSNLLRIMSVAILFLSVVQTTTGILQGMGREFVPLITLAIGAVLKIIVNYVLIGIPQLNIYGAPIGTIVCYATAGILNTILICFISNTRFSVSEIIVKPFVSVLCMMFVLAVLMVLLPGASVSRMFALAGVCVGAVVYGISLLLTGALTPEDMKLIPGGGRLTTVLRKAGIWR